MTTLRERVEGESSQLDLSFVGRRLEQRFRAHREKYPWVWDALVSLAREAKRRGRRRYGIAALFEIARWNAKHDERDDQGWKLDNTMRAFYSRALMSENPELAGLFEVRRQRSV